MKSHFEILRKTHDCCRDRDRGIHIKFGLPLLVIAFFSALNSQQYTHIFVWAFEWRYGESVVNRQRYCADPFRIRTLLSAATTTCGRGPCKASKECAKATDAIKP